MTSLTPRTSRRFRRLTLNTVITLYCLIIAGGVVRSTGAGMGCPDWPKCFGSWVPPTKVSQLPIDYKEIYGAKLKGEVEFNPVKTWIEYLNRLLGAFTGIMIFLTLVASIPYFRAGKRSIFYYSLVAFILVGVQGWLGSKVVSTELMPVMITLHMLLAIVIVFLLIYLYIWAKYFETFRRKIGGKSRAILNITGLGVLFLSLIQILLGTQVREAMDEVINVLGYGARGTWVSELGATFYVHRSFSIVVVAANLLWFYKIRQDSNSAMVLKRSAKWCLVLVGIELFTGILMAYFGVPPYAQPMHLTVAIALIGLQFVTWLLRDKEQFLDRDQSESLKGELV